MSNTPKRSREEEGGYSAETMEVIVVGNPAAPHIPAKNITAMTGLDHNRASAQVAARVGVQPKDVKKVIIWGNHSATQYPDVRHAKVTVGGAEKRVHEAVNDDGWLKGDFIITIQKRGAAIISKCKLSSAMSAAKASCDHIHDWFAGTKPVF